MSPQSRQNLAGGMILILLGVLFLALRLFPQFERWMRIEYSWPLIIVSVGVVLLLLGVIFNLPWMAVPACIVGGIGGLLWWQNATGQWESWAYAWALIPGFVGAGTVLAGLLGADPRRSIAAGLQTILVSLVLFAIFGSFLGGRNILGPFWPLLLIALGVILFARALLGRRPPSS